MFTVFGCSVLVLTALLSCSGNGGTSSDAIECDILIAGGGTGGFAAALQACSMAEEWGIERIVITEETTWLGGQYTSQGVTASDDNSLVERGRYDVGASESFYRFHEIIRDFYRDKALNTANKTKRNGGPGSKARELEIEWINGNEFSPGNAWGSRMSFLPKDGVRAIDLMLKPYLDSGLLTVYYDTVPVKVLKQDNRVSGVRFRNNGSGEEMTVEAAITLDATELGDLLPLAGLDYRIGIEASEDTGEPSLFDENGNALYPEPMKDCQQSFTYTFAVEWRPPTEDNRLPWDQRPASYEANRHRFTWVDSNRWFLMRLWNDYARAEAWKHNARTGENKPIPWIPSFWTYRRMLDARILDPSIMADLPERFIGGEWRSGFRPETNPEMFKPNWEHSPPGIGDIIEVNWNSNDYNDKVIIDVSPEARAQALREAKELSLGFMFWMWYDAPRDPSDPKLDPALEENWSVDPVTGKNMGYANLKFRPDVMGTEDGLSMYPYIRESRRIRGLFTVKQQNLMAPRTARAELFHDTVGIGHYFLDIHRCDVGCERKRDIEFKHVQLSDGSWAGENSSGRFQIPFGALVPEGLDGFMAAAKNISLTRIAASTYRLHPVEFEIGKAAGAAAVMCVSWNMQPRDFWIKKPGYDVSESEQRLRRLQFELLSANTPLFWNEDAGWDTDVFEAVQWASLLGIIEPHGPLFEPEKPLTRGEAVIAAARLSRKELTDSFCSMRFSDLTAEDADVRLAVTIIESTGALDWITGDRLDKEKPVTGEEFTGMLSRVIGHDLHGGSGTVLSRGEAAKIIYEELAVMFELPAFG